MIHSLTVGVIRIPIRRLHRHRVVRQITHGHRHFHCRHLVCVIERAFLYGIDGYVSFEPGMVSEYHYYTGILLAGYTYGTWEPIVKGGRYDRLLPMFGKNTPAIGFAIVVNQLLEALARQNIDVPVTHRTQLIVYTKEHQEDAVVTARKARGSGAQVELMRFDAAQGKDAYEMYAAKNHIARITYLI